jgi:hypothetical protein
LKTIRSEIEPLLFARGLAQIASGQRRITAAGRRIAAEASGRDREDSRGENGL